MRNFSISLLAAALCCACTPSAKVSCVVDGAPQARVTVKHLDLDGFGKVDTLTTDKGGACRFGVKVEKGQPEFVYIYYKDTKIASLLLESGQDRVKVSTDTLGNWSVEGSPSSEELREREIAYAGFLSSLNRAEDRSAMTKEYVSYYRSCVKYVCENPGSMTSIPVLYQKIGGSGPVFSQMTDALHFRKVCDSLKQIYPESKYVKALEKETVRRENAMQLDFMIKNAKPSSYPAIELPDINGQKSSLSAIDAKLVLVHFWDSSDPVQKMLNVDVLLPLYEEFHSKGLEIYAVGIDVDKVRWATVVSAQKLPWINVCDGLGAACPAVTAYNVTSLPATVLLGKDGILPAAVSGKDGLRKQISKQL